MKIHKVLAAAVSASALSLALAACGNGAQAPSSASSPSIEGDSSTSIAISGADQAAYAEALAGKGLVSTFIEADITDATVTNDEEALSVMESLVERMGGDSTTDLVLADRISTETGNTYYIFRQEAGGIIVFGGTAKLVVDKDGKVVALVSAILPNVKLPSIDELSFSQDQAEKTVEDALASNGVANAKALSEYTTLTLIPLPIADQAYCLAWVVYVKSPSGSEDDQAYLANYVSADGEFLYNMPVSEPNGAEALSGTSIQFDFSAYDQKNMTFDIARGGTTKQVSLPVLVDKQTGEVAFLGDSNRKILCADFTNVSENDQITSAFEADGKSFNDLDVAVYENFIRIYDFFETVGWSGPNGERTPALLLVDYRVNGEPADNCVYLGYKNGWETFGFGRAKDYGAATDIMAHEFVHCLTSTTMTTNLYMNEPGAINEGMSDILGNLTEMALDGDAGAWTLGENAVEGSMRSMANPVEHAQPGYRWDVYYTSDAPECTVMNDYGGVHGNSSLLNIVSYKLGQAGMSAEDQVYFWVNVALAMVPTNDFAQMAQLLPWVMEHSGYSQYVEALNKAIEEAGYTKLEAPAEPPAEAGYIEFTYPNKEDVKQGRVRVVFFTEAEAIEGSSDAWSWPAGEADTVRAILPAGDYYVMAWVGATPPEAENKLYTDKGWVDYSSDEGAINKVGTPVHVDAGQTVNIATDGLA